MSGMVSSWLAGGDGGREEIARAAAYWMTELMADDVSADTRRRWRQWMESDPAHREAWARFESLGVGLRTLNPAAARQGLSGVHDAGRRRAFKRVAAVAVGGVSLGALMQVHGWQSLVADYSTGVGEQRMLTLTDGTRLLLNTDSAVDVDFTAGLRLIRLRQGEVLIETGKDALDRPMRVETAQGWVAPLGTRFIVRQREADTIVSVLEHRVVLMADGWLRSYVLEAGQRAVIQPGTGPQARPLKDEDGAWARGELVADDVRLADFLAELSRYHRGWLLCDPAVADLRLTGLFPYMDTDRVLTAITQALPVRVQRHSRYWLKLVPA